MRHMDDGRLQAWIDGPRSGMTAEERAEVEAHLETCERCAARVEQLKAGDAEVAELLAAVGGGDEEIPDFAQVAARASGRGGGGMDEGDAPQGTPEGRVRRRISRRMAPAWAASILVALGAGWLWNEMTRNGVEPGLIRPAVETPAAERGPGDTLEMEVLEMRPEVQVPPPSEPGDRGQAAGADAATEFVAPPPAEDRQAAVSPTAAEDVPAPAEGEAPSPTEPMALRARLPSTTWRPVTRARADSLLGARVRSVPGLAVVSVESGAWLGSPAVRVRQVLDDGTSLVLYQSLGPDTSGEDEVGESMPIRVLPDGLRVSATAALSADSIRALLERIR